MRSARRTGIRQPQIWGIWRVLFGARGLYQTSANDAETVEVYGAARRTDWLERNVYARPRCSVFWLALLIDLAIFGCRLAIFVVQMLWIPLLGRRCDQRRSATPRLPQLRDAGRASRNIIPLGVLIGVRGVPQQPPRLTRTPRSRQQVVGARRRLVYIRLLEMLGLASVKRLARARRSPRTRAASTRRR